MSVEEIARLGKEGKLGQQEKIDGKDFTISFAVTGSGPDGTETALIKDGKYYILNGNWIEQYRPLVAEGYKACKKLFDDNKDEHINFWSN